MRITRKWLQKHSACYTDLEVDKLAAGRSSITVSELFDLPTYMWNRQVVVGVRFLSEEQQHEFMKACIEATNKYIDRYMEVSRAELANSYAYNTRISKTAEDAAFWARYTAMISGVTAEVEGMRQLNWLKETLNENHS